MSDFVTVVANHTVEVAIKGGDREVRRKGDKPFMIHTDDFAALGPDGLKAVRRPNKSERDPLDHDGNGAKGGAAASVAAPKTDTKPA